MAISNTAKDLINEVVFYANANAEEPSAHYLACFKDAMDDLEGFIRDLETYKDDADFECENLTKERDDLSERLDDSQREVLVLEIGRDALQDEVNDLENQIQDLGG